MERSENDRRVNEGESMITRTERKQIEWNEETQSAEKIRTSQRCNLIIKGFQSGLHVRQFGLFRGFGGVAVLNHSCTYCGTLKDRRAREAMR